MIRRQLGIFLLVGFSTVAVDFVVYHALLALLTLNVAKSLGFIAGTIFAYFANRRWTFKQQALSHRQSPRFALLYGFTLLCNVMVNEYLVWILSWTLSSRVATSIAFCCATGVSAVMNFVGMKYWVFREMPQTSDHQD